MITRITMIIKDVWYGTLTHRTLPCVSTCRGHPKYILYSTVYPLWIGPAGFLVPVLLSLLLCPSCWLVKLPYSALLPKAGHYRLESFCLMVPVLCLRTPLVQQCLLWLMSVADHGVNKGATDSGYPAHGIPCRCSSQLQLPATSCPLMQEADCLFHCSSQGFLNLETSEAPSLIPPNFS